MKNFLHTQLLTLLFSATVFMATAQVTAMQDSLLKGNQLYSAGKYAEAARTWEAIAAKGYESFELYYNLGNALYKTNNITYAILN